MRDVVIRAQGVGKQYRLGLREAPYKTLRESIGRLATAPARKLRSVIRGNPWRSKPETVWALRDIDLDVRDGEVLGVIGRNGAGKSTLLKILARISEPTTGRVELHGRVASLLEVGTGFHPELTGRENIFLNGAILGMRKNEIAHCFDEIVAFAEIDRFLDTPVKRYSSGMYIRLAFAVAAHLEPEILLIDEVLAVGDIAFQRKCLGKMRDIAGTGRTLVFVSHNLTSIEILCHTAILLDHGRVILTDSASRVVDRYMKDVNDQHTRSTLPDDRRSGTGIVRIVSFHIESRDGVRLYRARSGEPVRLAFLLENRTNEVIQNVDVGFSISSISDQPLVVNYSSFSNELMALPAGRCQISFLVTCLPFAPGKYRIGGRVLVAGDEADWPKSGLGLLDVQGGDFFGSGHSGHGTHAPVLLAGSWENPS